ESGEAPKPSIWPAVEQRILDLVRAHRSTIVFANSRRLAERLTSKLNELSAETAPISPTHHPPAASPVVYPKDVGRFPAEAIAESGWAAGVRDRKSTRLNSSHVAISYAVFCLKKKTSYTGLTAYNTF